MFTSETSICLVQLIPFVLIAGTSWLDGAATGLALPGLKTTAVPIAIGG